MTNHKIPRLFANFLMFHDQFFFSRISRFSSLCRNPVYAHSMNQEKCGDPFGDRVRWRRVDRDNNGLSERLSPKQVKLRKHRHLFLFGSEVFLKKALLRKI